MKLIIAGSRTVDLVLGSRELNEVAVENELHGGYPTELGDVTRTVSEVVSGACPTGGDKIGEQWACVQCIPIKRFPADWDTHGRAAGPIRNKQMAEYADALILIWDGKSPGSKNMKNWMNYYKKPIYEVIL